MQNRIEAPRTFMDIEETEAMLNESTGVMISIVSTVKPGWIKSSLDGEPVWVGVSRSTSRPLSYAGQVRMVSTQIDNEGNRFLRREDFRTEMGVEGSSRFSYQNCAWDFLSGRIRSIKTAELTMAGIEIISKGDISLIKDSLERLVWLNVAIA